MISVNDFIKKVKQVQLTDYIINSVLTCVLIMSILYSMLSLVKIIPVIKEIRTKVLMERSYKHETR